MRDRSNTTAGVHAGTVTSVEPEFVDVDNGVRFSGLGKTRFYEDMMEGKFRSILIRKPGAARGRRLVHLASLRAYLNSFSVEAA